MRRALLICHETSHVNEMRRVARLMKESGSWQPVFYFPRSAPEMLALEVACAAEGWSCRTERGASGAPGTTTSNPTRSRLQSVLRLLPGPAKEVLRWIRRYLSRIALLRSLAELAATVLREERVSLIVLAEDNVEHSTGVLVKQGHLAGIPSVVVPYTIPNALESAEAYIGRGAWTMGTAAKLFARRHPHWAFEHLGQRLLRLPVPEALATEHLGLAPPRPWILNSGHADAIAVESEAMHEHYQACGFPETQLVVTGALTDDDLVAAAGEASALRQKLGLDGRPVLLCAVPPDQVAVRTPQQCEFRSHAELVHWWLTTLSSVRQFQVVVSLHPRIRRESLPFLEGMDATIADVGVASLIPLCDLYVASVSATIRMAIACGKPVVNYDVYRYRYSDYAGVPGIVGMETREAFRDAVERFATDRGALVEAAAKQRSVASRWGRLDGGAGRRLLELFERVSATRAPSVPERASALR